MMVVVTFVSWMIHIYTIGYMHDDPGYQRFFSVITQPCIVNDKG
jgi:NADH-quinone oxidoreductase subunit L